MKDEIEKKNNYTYIFIFEIFIQYFFVEKYGFDTFFAYCDMSRQLIRWLSSLIRWLSSLVRHPNQWFFETRAAPFSMVTS